MYEIQIASNQSFINLCETLGGNITTTSHIRSVSPKLHQLILPFISLQRYKGFKICELLIDNSLALIYQAWKSWRTESLMCRCGRNDESAEFFFLACSLHSHIGPENLEPLKLLDPDDCNT